MNSRLLSKEVQDFIQKNLTSNLSKLILKGSPFSNVSIQELAQQIEGKQKAKNKLPLWFESENILFPKKINLEQTSSETTAAYKSNLVSGKSLIDLTGGFGIDCYYFSKKIKQVYHCEINKELSELVTHNYSVLKTQNIETCVGNGLTVIEEKRKKYDWIYIDPSRRNEVKGKVFLLADCLPNVPENLNFLFEYTDKILIKNSPILDITNTIRELNFVKEIHIVAVNNEVKELLFILHKNFKDAIQIKTCNINKTQQQNFDFEHTETTSAKFSLPKTYLFEPNAAILKSGGFHQIAHHFGIEKLHPHSHLYTSEEKIQNFPGRIFVIEKTLSYNKKEISKNIPEKKANITTRNFPETVAQIRKKTKIKDGGNNYLFFTTNCNNERIVLFCKKATD